MTEMWVSGGVRNIVSADKILINYGGQIYAFTDNVHIETSFVANGQGMIQYEASYLKCQILAMKPDKRLKWILINAFEISSVSEPRIGILATGEFGIVGAVFSRMHVSVEFVMRQGQF